MYIVFVPTLENTLMVGINVLVTVYFFSLKQNFSENDSILNFRTIMVILMVYRLNVDGVIFSHSFVEHQLIKTVDVNSN